MALRLVIEQRHMRAVIGNDRGAARLQPLENLGLGLGDRRFGAEKFDMGGRDGGDDRDMGPHLPGQRGQFARMVHAHFEHTERRLARHPRQAQRHADMVVVAFDRAVNLARMRAVERLEQRFLGPGLADRPSDADHFATHALARRAAQRFERGGAVGHQYMGMIHRLADDRPGRALGKGLVEELVPVGRFALHRDEQVAIRHFAAIERHARNGKRRRRGAARCLSDVCGGPQWPRHAPSSPFASSSFERSREASVEKAAHSSRQARTERRTDGRLTPRTPAPRSHRQRAAPGRR